MCNRARLHLSCQRVLRSFHLECTYQCRPGKKSLTQESNASEAERHRCCVRLRMRRREIRQPWSAEWIPHQMETKSRTSMWLPAKSIQEPTADTQKLPKQSLGANRIPLCQVLSV